MSNFPTTMLIVNKFRSCNYYEEYKNIINIVVDEKDIANAHNCIAREEYALFRIRGHRSIENKNHIRNSFLLVFLV